MITFTERFKARLADRAILLSAPQQLFADRVLWFLDNFATPLIPMATPKELRVAGSGLTFVLTLLAQVLLDELEVRMRA